MAYDCLSMDGIRIVVIMPPCFSLEKSYKKSLLPSPLFSRPFQIITVICLRLF